MKSQISSCRRHPNYQGKRQPKTDCKVCWAVWMEQNPVSRISKNLIAGAKLIVPSPVIELPVLGETEGDEEQFALLLSDLQVGVTTPTFNFAIFHKRMEALAKNVAKVTALHRRAHPVHILNVFMLGDIWIMSPKIAICWKPLRAVGTKP